MGFSMVVLEAAALLLGKLAKQYQSIEEKCKKWQGRIMILAYFFYSPVSAKLFQTFNCRDISQVYYLHSDYSIRCDSATHRLVQSFAWILAVLVSVGLPAMYFFELWSRRERLPNEKYLRFFIRDYTPSMWWWECAELLKRLMLTGAAVFFNRGTLMQIALSMSVVVSYLLALLLIRPYQQHNTFAFSTNTLLFFTLFAGLFVKLKAGFNSNGRPFNNSNRSSIWLSHVICCRPVRGGFLLGLHLWSADYLCCRCHILVYRNCDLALEQTCWSDSKVSHPPISDFFASPDNDGCSSVSFRCRMALVVCGTK
jgi:hypothetical protein